MCIGEGSLRLLNFSPKFLGGPVVLPEVFAVLLLENLGIYGTMSKIMTPIFADSRLAYLDKVFHDTLIKVLSAQMCVSVGGKDLKDAVGDGEQRNIESSAAKIKYEDFLFSAALVVQAVCDSCSSGLIDDPA